MDEESTPTKCFVRVAVPENICLQCGGLVENAALRRRLFSRSNKTKACQNLELLLGDAFQAVEEKSAIVCRNCSDRNETLCKKIFIARENFSKTKEGLEARMGSSVYVKRLTRASDHNEHAGAKKSSTKRRALFDASESAISVEEVCEERPVSILHP